LLQAPQLEAERLAFVEREREGEGGGVGPVAASIHPPVVQDRSLAMTRFYRAPAQLCNVLRNEKGGYYCFGCVVLVFSLVLADRIMHGSDRRPKASADRGRKAKRAPPQSYAPKAQYVLPPSLSRSDNS